MAFLNTHPSIFFFSISITSTHLALLPFFQQSPQLPSGISINSCCWLIQKDHFWVSNEGNGNGQFSLLSTCRMFMYKRTLQTRQCMGQRMQGLFNKDNKNILIKVGILFMEKRDENFLSPKSEVSKGNKTQMNPLYQRFKLHTHDQSDLHRHTTS